MPEEVATSLVEPLLRDRNRVHVKVERRLLLDLADYDSVAMSKRTQNSSSQVVFRGGKLFGVELSAPSSHRRPSCLPA